MLKCYHLSEFNDVISISVTLSIVLIVSPIEKLNLFEDADNFKIRLPLSATADKLIEAVYPKRILYKM